MREAREKGKGSLFSRAIDAFWHQRDKDAGG